MGPRSHHQPQQPLTFVFLRLWSPVPQELSDPTLVFQDWWLHFNVKEGVPPPWETRPSSNACADKDRRSLALIQSSPAGRLMGILGSEERTHSFPPQQEKGNEARKVSLDILFLWEGKPVKVSWVKRVINLKKKNPKPSISPPALPHLLGLIPGGIPQVELPKGSRQGFKEEKKEFTCKVNTIHMGIILR